MDLRHMRHFVAVAEELHFGRAAKRLNMAQPPLSQSIRRLEIELGIDLLDRTRRSVELNDAGRIFLEEARRTLLQAELTRKLAQRAANKSLEVQVSFIGPALYRILPSLLVAFRGVRPDVEVRLFEQASAAQMTGIAAGDFEVGFTSVAIGDAPGFETLLVEQAPIVAAVPADWPIARQAAVTLAELAEQPFIRTPEKYHPQSSETVTLFKNLGMMPRVVQEATQTNTTLSLVGASLGWAVVTATAAMVQPRNVRLLPIADDIVISPWQLLMVWRAQQIGPAARAFVETAQRYIAAHPHLVAPRNAAEALEHGMPASD